jgi:hypothetical protein
MNSKLITLEYYDNVTYTMLLETISDDDREYMKNNTDETTETLMCKRWNTIINSLPHNYYNQYYSQTNQQDRNSWFKKYLDYPTKHILDMPELL